MVLANSGEGRLPLWHFSCFSNPEVSRKNFTFNWDTVNQLLDMQANPTVILLIKQLLAIQKRPRQISLLMGSISFF